VKKLEAFLKPVMLMQLFVSMIAFCVIGFQMSLVSNAYHKADDNVDFKIYSIQFHVHWCYLCSLIANIIVTDRGNPVRCTMGISGLLLSKSID